MVGLWSDLERKRKVDRELIVAKRWFIGCLTVYFLAVLLQFVGYTIKLIAVPSNPASCNCNSYESLGNFGQFLTGIGSILGPQTALGAVALSAYLGYRFGGRKNKVSSSNENVIGDPRVLRLVHHFKCIDPAHREEVVNDIIALLNERELTFPIAVVTDAAQKQNIPDEQKSTI